LSEFTNGWLLAEVGGREKGGGRRGLAEKIVCNKYRNHMKKKGLHQNEMKFT